HRGKVITRQYEAERRQHVLLVLDLGRLMTAEAAGVSRLDYVVQAALELAYTAVQHDDNVGVMAFADGVQHFVVPQRGRLALRRAREEALGHMRRAGVLVLDVPPERAAGAVVAKYLDLKRRGRL